MKEEYKKIPRMMIAAPKSGSGKTIITCGILQYFINRKLNIVSFKCGPDYIDPMYHRKVLGLSVGNLDTYFTSKKDVMEILASTKGEFAVIEGVMGIYDGLGGTDEKASSYDVALATKTPVILVVDAYGCGRTLISQIKGILDDDYAGIIQGVILNRISGDFYNRIKPYIEETFIEKSYNCRLLGYVPNNKAFEIGSRHLGLQLPNEIEELSNKFNEISEILNESIDFDLVMNIMNQAEPVQKKNIMFKCEKAERNVKIAVAMDEAFCFYYQENIQLLESLGAQIIPFSPIHDKELPNGIDGFILGGGYPELYLEKLSNNKTMLESIRNSIDKKVPSLAECGGFMYLHRSVENKNGKSFTLVGAIDGDCRYMGKLVRFGYSEVFQCNGNDENYSLAGLKGHEFHYYDSTDNGHGVLMKKPTSDKTWDAIHIVDGSVWGFPHFYYPSNPRFIEQFINKCKK